MILLNRLFKGVRSVFDLHGRPLRKRHSAEDNLHATWNNVGVFLSRGMERATEGTEKKPLKTLRKSRYF